MRPRLVQILRQLENRRQRALSDLERSPPPPHFHPDLEKARQQLTAKAQKQLAEGELEMEGEE